MTATVLEEVWPLDAALPAELTENLCHLLLSNGWTISILVRPWSFETWAWPTGSKWHDLARRRPSSPAYHQNVEGCFAFVEQAKEWDRP